MANGLDSRLPVGWIAGALTVLAVPAQADVFVPTNTLGLSGATALQQRTGQAVQSVCGQFVAEGVDDSRNDVVLQQDLFDKCGEMVHTANRLAGNDGPTNKDLGITGDELQAALQNIAGEEIAAAGSVATELTAQQAANVSKRISSLLSAAPGLQLSAVNVYGTEALYGAGSGGGRTYGGAAGDGTGPSFYVNGLAGDGDRSATDTEDAFDASTTGITVGFDYGYTSSMVLGAALGYNNASADFIESATVSGGELEFDSAELSLYGLWFGERAYADAILSYGTGSLDLERHIEIAAEEGQVDPTNGAPNDGADRIATADTDSSQLGLSLGAGLEYARGPWSFAPYTRLSYLGVEVDGYEESGAEGLNLAVEQQDIDSLTAALGLRLVRVASLSFGVLSPQISLEYIHEFDDDSREIVSRYIHDPRENALLAVTDDPDRNYLVAGIGVTSVTRGGLQLFAEVKSLLELENVDETVVAAGARFEF